MNPNPVKLSVLSSNQERQIILHQHSILHLPLVDEVNRLVGVYILPELAQVYAQVPKRQNPVILMAGGLGTRLLPLTENTPKPMLQVGDKPILETILLHFIRHGFSNFYISVNYLSDIIIDYFGDGSKWGVSIHYLKESKRMGTGGALSLLPFKPSVPLIVMNADLLTTANVSAIMDYHIDNKADATVCVRSYEVTIPYGVVDTEKGKVIGISEKPTYRYYVNAGIYCLNPEALTWIPNNSFFDLPDLMEIILQKKLNLQAFGLQDYWLDIGQPADYQRANEEYWRYFH
jgi:NDP-sugar pyrophosphorylase family protein